MPTEMLSAIIAGGVSLVAAVLTFAVGRRTIATERHRFAHEMQRRLTERLIDRRLLCYTAAFEITDDLRSDVLLRSGQPTPEHLQAVRERLLGWLRSEAALVMSAQSVAAAYKLRDALAESEASVSPPMLEYVWGLKHGLRASLRADLGLLYAEESSDTLTNRLVQAVSTTKRSRTRATLRSEEQTSSEYPVSRHTLAGNEFLRSFEE